MFLTKLYAMLKFERLSKRYGDYPVFSGLTHAFTSGCVALSEQESSGKSTLLDILAGVLPPDEGDVWIQGHSMRRSPKKAKLRLAYVPRDCMMFPHLSGHGLLAMMANQKKTRVTEAAIQFAHDLGLEPHMDKPFEQMSTGTRRKVYLAAAVLGNPSVILADGPTDGLDARARGVVADQFRVWSRDRAVLFASYDEQFIEACGARAMTVAQLAARSR